jgi:hypothetical protein
MCDDDDINRHPLLTPIVGALVEPLAWPAKPVWWLFEALVETGVACGYDPAAIFEGLTPLMHLAQALDTPWRFCWWGYLRRFEGHGLP